MSKQLLARVNGAGIGDLANARGFRMQGGVSLKNEKRPLKAFVRKVSFGPQKALLLFGVLFNTCVPLSESEKKAVQHHRHRSLKLPRPCPTFATQHVP